jgi:hypothetical protein
MGKLQKLKPVHADGLARSLLLAGADAWEKRMRVRQAAFPIIDKL